MNLQYTLVRLLILDEHADDAQQAFSYESRPCLHTGNPALEALHTAWKNHSKLAKFEMFSIGLDAAMKKVEEYYEKTVTSHAYTFTMCQYTTPYHYLNTHIS